MAYCQKIKMDCIYTDRDNTNNCSLDICKFMIGLQYKPDGSFETIPIVIKKSKSKE